MDEDVALARGCKRDRYHEPGAAACEQRHKNSCKETTAALRLFRDTLRVLIEADANDGDVIDMLECQDRMAAAR